MPDIILTLILDGDVAVGKTCIRTQFIDKKFNPELLLTLGADFGIKSIEIDSLDINYHIWDLSGNRRFDKVKETYYQGVHGIILVYDCTSYESLVNIIDRIEFIKQNVEKDQVYIMIAGNKVDLKDSIKVKEVHVNKILNKLKNMIPDNFSLYPSYLEVSAKTGKNVEELFFEFGKFMIKTYEFN